MPGRGLDIKAGMTQSECDITAAVSYWEVHNTWLLSYSGRTCQQLPKQDTYWEVLLARPPDYRKSGHYPDSFGDRDRGLKEEPTPQCGFLDGRLCYVAADSAAVPAGQLQSDWSDTHLLSGA